MVNGLKQIHVGNKYLQIQGFVDKDVLHELIGKTKYTKQNTYWVFVDYSAEEFKLNSRFNIVLEGEEKKMSPHIYDITLLTVLDQFGNRLESLQEGWKTICRLEFNGDVAKSFRNLPLLETWKYNKNSLKIANNKDLRIDTNNISKSVYSQVFRELFFFVFNTESINKKDFLFSLKNVYLENKEELNDKIPADLFKEAEKELQEIKTL